MPIAVTATQAPCSTSSERDVLVREHLHLVTRIAMSFRKKFPKRDLDDLVCDGMLGLVSAAQSFDPSKGTFDYWACNKIHRAILDGQRSFYGLPRESRQSSMPRIVSLFNGTGTSIDDTIAALSVATAQNIEEQVCSSETNRENGQLLHALIGILGCDQRFVILEYYFAGRTLTSISQTLGFSVSRVSQIRREALEIMLNPDARRPDRVERAWRKRINHPSQPRQQVMRYLRQNGGLVRDPNGSAVKQLADTLSVKDNSLRSLLREMRQDGLIVFTIQGSLTFCIRLAGIREDARPRFEPGAKKLSPQRQRVIDILQSYGGVLRDPGGFVARQLAECLNSSLNTTNSLLCWMERDGLIVRRTSGSRTYLIRLSGTPEKAPSTWKRPINRLSPARQQVIKLLIQNQGTIRDKDGFVTTPLAEALGSNQQAMIRLLYKMERDGLITREGRRGRTYAISLASAYMTAA
jgi:RNA polymerase sigma factor (sigma-70 family)